MPQLAFRICLIFTVLLFAHCSSPSTSGDEVEEAGQEVTAEEAEVQTNRVSDLLAPNNDDLSFPVYTSYDEMADLLQQDDGRTYVVNFWATWCQPCIAEMPYFEQLAAEADDDVEVIMVSLDFQRDVRSKLKKFVTERPLDLQVVALTDGDYNSWIDRVDPDWGGAIPVTMVYRGDNRRFHGTEFKSYEELQELVASVN